MIPFNTTETDTEQAVTLVIDGVPQTIRSSNKRYEEIMEALKARDWDLVKELVDLATQIVVKSNGLFTVEGNDVLIDGDVIPASLGKKIMSLAEKGLPFEPFIAFWKNLRNNPSNRSVQCLFNFLDHNHVALTEDGCFVAYKGVRADFKDCHTGTIDNSPGKVVSMPRNKVDDDPNRTCSHGLHVAGWGYASGTAYGGAAKYLMIKVNPEHVVSVPPDYDFQKMRVCQYEVLKEVDKPEGMDTEYLSANGGSYHYNECETCDEDCDEEDPCDDYCHEDDNWWNEDEDEDEDEYEDDLPSFED